MNPDDSAAPVRELAAQLIAYGRNDDAHVGTPESVALGRLSAELCRWVGAEGCRTLLGRALASAQRGRPGLGDLRVGSGTPPLIEGVREGVEAHGPAAMALGIEATMITMLELLNRLIGEDLTTRLAERSMTGAAPGAIPPTQDERPPDD